MGNINFLRFIFFHVFIYGTPLERVKNLNEKLVIYFTDMGLIN